MTNAVTDNTVFRTRPFIRKQLFIYILFYVSCKIYRVLSGSWE